MGKCTLVTTGRTDIESYFKSSGIREYSKLNQTPVLVFAESEMGVTVEIVDKPKQLLDFPNDCKCMAQWKGEYKSDFFQFTIGDLKKYIQENPPESYHKI